MPPLPEAKSWASASLISFSSYPLVGRFDYLSLSPLFLSLFLSLPLFTFPLPQPKIQSQQSFPHFFQPFQNIVVRSACLLSFCEINILCVFLPQGLTIGILSLLDATLGADEVEHPVKNKGFLVGVRKSVFLAYTYIRKRVFLAHIYIYNDMLPLLSLYI